MKHWDAPSIERLLLDGWDATKPKLQATGFVSYQSLTGVTDPQGDETVPHPSDVFVLVRWVGARRAHPVFCCTCIFASF